jgi:hypothetical protein
LEIESSLAEASITVRPNLKDCLDTKLLRDLFETRAGLNVADESNGSRRLCPVL